jgi:hypothetical protein
VCSAAGKSTRGGRKPIRRDLLGDAPALGFRVAVLAEAEQIAVIALAHYPAVKLVPVGTLGVGDNGSLGVEETPDGGGVDVMAAVDLIFAEECSERVGDGVHGHDDLWLQLGIEPGDQSEV